MSQLGVQVGLDILASSDSAEQALRKLSAAQKEADFAKMKPGIQTGIASLEDLKKKLEETTVAAKGTGNSLGQLKKIGRLAGLSGRAFHIPELKALGGEMRLVSMAASSFGAPMFAVAAVIGAVGAAAVMASPKLQDTLGRALFITKEQAEATEKALRKLKDTGENLRLARSMGGGTLEESHRERALAGAAAPHLARQGALGRSREEAMARAAALTGIQVQAFDPTHQALEQLHAQALDQGGPNRKPGDSHLMDPAALAALANKPFQTPGLLQRQMAEAQAKLKNATKDSGQLRGRQDVLAEKADLTEKMAKGSSTQRELMEAQRELREIQENPDLIRDQKTGKLRGSGIGERSMSAAENVFQRFHNDLGTSGASADQQAAGVHSDLDLQRHRTEQNAVARLERAREAHQKGQKDMANLQARHAQLGGGDPAKDAQEQLRVGKELEQANDRQRKAQEDILRIKQQIGQADIGNLKTIQATVAEQLKAAAAERRHAEGKLRGAKVELGGMDKRDLRQVQQLANRIDEAMKGGRQLSRGEMQAAGRHGVLREKLEGYNEKQADKDPAVKALTKQLGLDKKVVEAKDREKGLANFNVDLKTKIQATVEINSKQMADQIKDELVPIIKQAFQDAVKAAAQAVQAAVIDIKLKEQAQAQAQKRANINAGGKGGG